MSRDRRPWDEGVTWFWDIVTAPVLGTLDPLSLDFVRDQHLRAADDTAENEWIEQVIAASYHQAERKTWRALCRQTLRMVLDRFPLEMIVLARPPLLEVTSITYVDGDGVRQTWNESPLTYDVMAPSGPTAAKGQITPSYSYTWPSIRPQADAVIVTYEAGYDEAASGFSDIPMDITHGRLLWIAEAYKQRSLSVHAFSQNPALVQAEALWRMYRAF